MLHVVFLFGFLRNNIMTMIIIIVLCLAFYTIHEIKKDNARYYALRKEIIDRANASGDVFDQSGLPIPRQKD